MKNIVLLLILLSVQLFLIFAGNPRCSEQGAVALEFVDLSEEGQTLGFFEDQVKEMTHCKGNFLKKFSKNHRKNL